MKKTLLAAFAAGAFAQDFPSYFEMDGTKITDCDKDDISNNLVIPDGVTEIGGTAFRVCENLAVQFDGTKEQ